MHPAILDALIALLIAQLGHPHYHHREVASRVLHSFAHIATAQIEQATKHPDPEIQHRAAKLYRPFREAKLETEAFALVAEFPWLWLEDCTLTQFYLDLAVKRFGIFSGGPDWPNYRAATKLYVRDLLFAGEDVSRIRALLDNWAERDRRWREAHQQ